MAQHLGIEYRQTYTVHVQASKLPYMERSEDARRYLGRTTEAKAIEDRSDPDRHLPQLRWRRPRRRGGMICNVMVSLRARTGCPRMGCPATGYLYSKNLKIMMRIEPCMEGWVSSLAYLCHSSRQDSNLNGSRQAYGTMMTRTNTLYKPGTYCTVHERPDEKTLIKLCQIFPPFLKDTNKFHEKIERNVL